jgi:hypothetical protein
MGTDGPSIRRELQATVENGLPLTKGTCFSIKFVDRETHPEPPEFAGITQLEWGFGRGKGPVCHEGNPQ